MVENNIPFMFIVTLGFIINWKRPDIMYDIEFFFYKKMTPPIEGGGIKRMTVRKVCLLWNGSGTVGNDITCKFWHSRNSTISAVCLPTPPNFEKFPNGARIQKYISWRSVKKYFYFRVLTRVVSGTKTYLGRSMLSSRYFCPPTICRAPQYSFLNLLFTFTGENPVFLAWRRTMRCRRKWVDSFHHMLFLTASNSSVSQFLFMTILMTIPSTFFGPFMSNELSRVRGLG